MVKFEDSKIYKIVDNTNGNIYIGSTCEPTLARRLTKHKSSYNFWLNNNKNTSFMTSFKILENNDYDIVLVEKCQNITCRDELFARERYYIEINNCVNKYKPITSNEEKKEYYKIYYEANKDEQKEYHKIYYEANKDEINEKGKLYREENSDVIKKYREANKEKIREYQKLYDEKHYELNKEAILERNKEYRVINKEKIKIQKSEKHMCCCGCEYSNDHKTRHESSKRHKDLMEKMKA